MNQKTESLDIRDCFYILKKHFLFILLVVLLFVLSSFGITEWVIQPQYESDAFVIVNTEQSSVTNITNDQITAAQQLVNTYSIILRSEPVLDQVIQNLGLDTNAKMLAQKISIKGVNETEVMDISVRDSNPQIAADIANEITRIAPSAIISTVKAGSVGIIAPAKKMDNPVSPNKPLYMGIAFLSGLLLSVVISLLIETMNNTFASGKDVQKYLEYPVLGVIPNVRNREYQRR